MQEPTRNALAIVVVATNDDDDDEDDDNDYNNKDLSLILNTKSAHRFR